MSPQFGFFVFLWASVGGFLNYGPPQQQIPQYPAPPVPRGYQPPPDPPLVADFYGSAAQWSQNPQRQPGNQWNPQQNSQPNGQYPANRPNPPNQQYPPNPQSQQYPANGNPQYPANPQFPANSPEPVLINTLIQVYTTDTEPDAVFSTLTAVRGNERIAISKNSTLEPRHRFGGVKPANFAHVRAFAATNNTRITKEELRAELDRELEAAIPSILEELDKAATTASPATANGDVTDADLEGLVDKALQQFPTTTPAAVTTIPPATNSANFVETTMPLIIFQKTTTPMEPSNDGDHAHSTQSPQVPPIPDESNDQQPSTLPADNIPQKVDQITQNPKEAESHSDHPVETEEHPEHPVESPDHPEEHPERHPESTHSEHSSGPFDNSAEATEQPQIIHTQHPEAEDITPQPEDITETPKAEANSTEHPEAEGITEENQKETKTTESPKENTTTQPDAQTTPQSENPPPETTAQSEIREQTETTPILILTHRTESPQMGNHSAELIVPHHAIHAESSETHPRTWKPQKGATKVTPPLSSTTTTVSTPIAPEVSPVTTDSAIVVTQNAEAVTEGAAHLAECAVPNDDTDPLRGDVLFVVDGSSTVPKDQFSRSIKLIHDTVKEFRNVGPDGVRFSLVQFGAEPVLEFSFRAHDCIVDLLEDISNTELGGGKADLNRAVEKAMKFALSPARGERADAPNVLVLVADGPGDDPKIDFPIQMIKQNDATLLLIASVRTSPNALLGLTSDSDVFNLTDVLNRPLAPRLADRITEVLSSNTPAESNDAELTTTISPNSANSENGPIVDENVQIECLGDRVGITVRVAERFGGRLAAKDHEGESECSVEIPRVDAESETLRNIGLGIRSGHCGLNVVQSAEPKGTNRSIVINLFHNESLVTAEDRSFVVECFTPILNAEKNVETRLNVDGVLPISRTVSLEAVPPSCEYTLRRDSPNGPILQSASIGQIVYHRWECEGPEEITAAYGLHIHDCFASNGSSHNYQIIDSKGCSADKSLLSEIVYAEDRILAHVRSFVFSFVDVESLLFSCKISLCVRDGDGCEGYSPPLCSKSNMSEVLLTRKVRQLDPWLATALTLEVESQNVALNDPLHPHQRLHLAQWANWAVLAAAVFLGSLFGILCYCCRRVDSYGAM